MYLCYCGQSRCMPLHNYGPTVRPNYIIHYITEGKGCFCAEGNKYELEAGQGFLIVPGQQTFYQADKELPWTYLWVGFDGGNVDFCAEGNKYELEAGQGFLIVPGQQTFYQADKELPWTYLWVGFDGGNVESYLKEIGLTSEKPVYRCENGKVLQEIVGEMLENQKASFSGQLLLEGLLYRFFAALAENIEMPALSRQESENLYVKRAMEFIRNNYFEDIKVTELLYRFFAALAENIEMPALSRQESENLYVKRAMEFIRNNYFEDIKVTDIADYVSVNRSYLYTLFQKSLHMSPSRYLAEIRMSQAEKLLLMTDFSIEVTARSCGYRDTLSFTRIFKEHFKMPPSQYRKEKRKEQI